MSTRFITAIVSVASIGLIAVAEETEITATAGDARIRTRVDVQTNEVEEAVVERLEGGTWTVKETATDAVEDVIEDVEDPMASVDFVDCNENGIDDAVELAEGVLDSNGNRTLDECEFAYGDLNLDMVIDGSDLFIVFGWWASPFPLFGDLNFDGVVDAGDTGLLLVRWGPTPF